MHVKQCRIGKSPAFRVMLFHLLILSILLFLPASFTINSAHAADCAEDYPLIAVVTVGSSHGDAVNNAMLLKFVGHITNRSSLVNGLGSTVRLCPNTTLVYSVLAANIDVDPYPDARCFIDGRRVGNRGALRIGEHFVCHDPNSGDSDRIRIKQAF